jgi:8-oxo-dGTP diphosphatase
MIKGIDYIGVSASFFCHDGQGNFVMAKRSQNARDERGNWDCGGGGVEFGHTVEETLHKEIKEEYGADILSYEFLGYREAKRMHEGTPTHWVSLDFKVLVDPSQVKNNEPRKFDDLAWFTLSNLPTPLHSQFPAFLEKYKGKL